MARSKFINTFDTTSDYNNYIDSALPEFPNVGYDKQAGEVIIRRYAPNNYQIWGTTTATSNFNIKLNNTLVEVTVDTLTGEFYLTGWIGTLTRLESVFKDLTYITSLKKLAINTSSLVSTESMFRACSNLTYVSLQGCNTSNLINMNSMFYNCSSLTTLDLSDCDFSNVTNINSSFYNCNSLSDVYITVEATLMKLTNNLSAQGNSYVPSSATIHYDNGSEVIDYKWQNNAWTPQS